MLPQYLERLGGYVFALPKGEKLAFLGRRCAGAAGAEGDRIA